LLHELSLVRHTANCGTKPIAAVPGDLSRGTSSQPRNMPLDWDATWERAAEAMPRQRYRPAHHTTIVDLDPPDQVSAPPAPTGPTVNWYGTELRGEVAQRVVDALTA
jgi:hypothetical protein